MLTDHDTRREHDEYDGHDEHDARDHRDVRTEHGGRDDRDVPREGESRRDHQAQMRFPSLDEPAWLEDDDLDGEEMDAASDSPLRGIWIGILAAAVTFVLVFAVPQWLGWYDIAEPPKAKREATPESVISTVTAQPSGTAVVETAQPAAPAAAAPPATA
ncbi:MAG: hypothetical protein ACRELW_15900, partial [Candidatus Rokuibacteriota bacterium]